MAVNKEWTAGRLKSFITSTIRAGFRRYPPKYETLKEAFIEKKKNPASGKIASFYKCNKCKKAFTAKNIQVDHINPVVDPVVGFVDWEVFIKRLFCDKKNLQILCLVCHKKKTEVEKIKRKK